MPVQNLSTVPGFAVHCVDLRVTSASEKRREIHNVFNQTFSLYERLFDPITEDAYIVRPDRLRHPLIFYYGHTAVFYMNKLILARLFSPSMRVNCHVESMCSIGVDEMSWDDLPEAKLFPPLKEIAAYRNEIRKLVSSLIMRLELSDHCTINDESPWWVILMGIEHERIHLETSSVLIRQLPLNCLDSEKSTFALCLDSSTPESLTFVSIPGGEVKLGRDQLKEPFLFGWDNEYGHKTKIIPAFNAAKTLTTSEQFLDFVCIGGYQTQRFWTDEGWKWKSFMSTAFPKFWVLKNVDLLDEPASWTLGDFRLRCLYQEIEMPSNWPVETNYHEAKAFANWKSESEKKSMRLMNEFEYHRCVELANVDGMETNVNFNLKFGSSTPVDRNISSIGLGDLTGNCWQWMETIMEPFEGFKVHPIYDDFTTPTFDGQHHLIKG